MRYKSKRAYAWGANVAYVIGLIASDGCLSKDNRHIDFTSKDLQLVELYRNLIRPSAAIGTKRSGAGNASFRVQFGDVAFYDFLLSVGLTPRKSHTIQAVNVPNEFFADFLRGLFDGDGCIYGVVDRRWKNSFMFYTCFASASLPFLEWLQSTIQPHLPAATGHIRKSRGIYNLAYAKRDSRALFSFMYYRPNVPRLERKYQRYLEIFNLDPYPK